MTQAETPAALLAGIADALNKLSGLGERVAVKYDAVMTDHGYVWADRKGNWTAKLKNGEMPEWITDSADFDDD